MEDLNPQMYQVITFEVNCENPITKMIGLEKYIYYMQAVHCLCMKNENGYDMIKTECMPIGGILHIFCFVTIPVVYKDDHDALVKKIKEM